MKSAKLRFAALLLRIVRWYFVGRAVTCVAYDSNGLSYPLPGRITGGRITHPIPGLTLIWMPTGGDISDPVEVSAYELQAVSGRWQFFDITPVD